MAASTGATLLNGTMGATLVPVPPRDPRPHAAPGRMARPEVRTLNSYAVSVGWTPPADLHSRRARDAVTMRRGLLSGVGGSALGQDVEPVGGYRLRYWVRPCGNGQPPVTEYGTMPDYVEVEETWPSSASHAVLKWLVAGQAYVFEVAAFNSAGVGPWSDPSDCFIMPRRPDGRQPQKTALLGEEEEVMPSPPHLSSKPDQIEVRWPAPCHRGAAITSYDIMCSKDPDFKQFTRQLRTTGESTALVVRDLEPNTVYYFKHRAVNEKGPSGWSDSTPGVATQAKPPERPGPPARLGDHDSFQPREVSIKWDAPESYGVPIQHFRVRCSTRPDMSEAVEVPVGADSKGATKIESSQSDCPSAPSSPAGRRPGFNKGHYALTQLKVRGLMPMTAYYFQVQAINQIGASEWSHASQPMPTSAAPPGRAGRPRFASGTKLGGMRICWAVPDSFGSHIERYDVRVSRYTMMLGATEHTNVLTHKAEPEQWKLDKEEEFLEATIPGCWEPATDHFYQVRAVNAAGVGEWSESSEAMLVSPERPLRPEAPHSFDSLHRTSLVRWKAPDCRGSALQGYRLRYSTTRDMMYPVEVQGVYGPVTEFAVTGLHPHGSYFFQVCAFNAVGCSDWSPPSSLVKVRQVPPAKLSAPTLRRETSSSVTVAFVNPADSGTRDGELIQSYVLYYAPAGEKHSPVELAGEGKLGAGIIPRADPSGVEVKGLRPGRRYQFQIMACNEYGDGEPSEVAEFSTASAVPDAPEAPLLAERTEASITLVVKPGSDNGTPHTYLELEAEMSETGKRWLMPRIPIVHNEDGMQYYAVTDLRPGVLYRFRALTANREGDSPYSASSEEYSTNSTPPEHVHGLRSEDVRARSYRLLWELPYHNGEQVIGYRVQWCQEEAFEKTVQQLDVVERWAVLEGCTPGLPSYARVAAKNAEGHGPFSRPIATNLGADVPDAPMHVQPVGVGPINVRLGWIMPYDCGSPITDFWVRYAETATDGRAEKNRDKGEVLVQGRKRFCSVEPLFSKREYIYHVAAQNAIGKGPWSEASLPTRIGPPAVPTAPEKPIFLEASTTTLTFKWNASEGMGANVLEQIVHVSTDPLFAEGSYITISVPAWSSLQKRQVGRLKHTVKSPHAEDTLSQTELAAWEASSGLGKPDTSSRSRPVTKSTAAGATATPGTSRPTTLGASGPVTGQPLRPVSESSSRPSSQQPTRMGDAEVLTLDGALGPSGAGAFGEDEEEEEEEEEEAGPEDELLQPFAQEVMMRRKSSSCGIDQLQLSNPAITAPDTSAGEEGAPKMVQLAETFDDIFPMDNGAAVMQRASAHYKRPELIGEYVLPSLHAGTFYYIRVAGRNSVGLGPFSPPSKRVSTSMSVPRAIPQDTGLVLLRSGCTSLTLGWMRPDCQGLPVTHYLVRCAETRAALESGECLEWRHEEVDRETWPGIVSPQPYPYPLCPPEKPDSEGKDAIVGFATYLMQRFQTLQESWEWLDVNGNGDISREEFMEGDEDGGDPPFMDFPGGQEALDRVWQMLDADGGGAIGLAEYSRLRPFFEAVRSGSAGMDWQGIYCLVPSLKPGKQYYFMARAVNNLGMSEWTHCLQNPVRAETLTPDTMLPVRAVRQLRKKNSVTLTWDLPHHGGDPLTRVELRYVVQDVDEGVPSRAALRDGVRVDLPREREGEGPLPTQYKLIGLQPGQVAIAIARAHNRTGGSRLWSETPSAKLEGHYQEDIRSWDCTTLPDHPSLPETLPYFKVDTLMSYKCETSGELAFCVGRSNGLPFSAFDFQLLDEEGEVEREWRTASSPEESAAIRARGGLVQRSFIGLHPGVRYQVRVRCVNSEGASDWCEPGPWATMPADVPSEPDRPRSEFTSLTWVDLKFSPPRANGATIEKYSIRTSMVEDAEDEDWRVLTDEEVAESLRPYKGGRRVAARDIGALLCRVNHLKTGTPHYFCLRAMNCIGWSPWSETGLFITKPARPGRVPGVATSHAGARDIDIHWEEPEMNGLPALRYELICGSSLNRMRWAQVVSVLLCATPDTDRIFGELVTPELGVAKGREAMRELVSEETMFLPLDGGLRARTVEGLLPAQEYYFAIRVVTAAGRGEFSDLFGPVATGPEKPCDPLPPTAQPLSESSCRVLINLPYDNGLPILRATLSLLRSYGPLASEELDGETGDAQEHIARRDLVLDPRELPKVELPGAAGPDGRQRRPAGCTASLVRSYKHEGLEVEALQWDGCAHSRESATGRRLAVLLGDLKPGTSYRVQWACSNELGWSSWTLPEIRFETEPAQPDKPASLEIHCSL